MVNITREYTTYGVSKQNGRILMFRILPRLDQPIRPPPLKPPLPLSAAEDAKKRPEPAKKCFVWSEYKESGFSSRASVLPQHLTYHLKERDTCGYHATEDERTKHLLEADRTPFFHTGPIDVT